MAEGETRRLIQSLAPNQAMTVDGAIIRNLSARRVRLSIEAPLSVVIRVLPEGE